MLTQEYKNDSKQYIIDLFVNNVKNKNINIKHNEKKHDGAEGHFELYQKFLIFNIIQSSHI
jgi:hypothetical protein